MKQMAMVIMMCLVSSLAWGANIDITPEALPTIDKAQIDTILIRYFTGQAQVIVRKGFVQDGKFVAMKEDSLLFMDREDDPRTPENETSTDFTDFISAIKLDKVKVENFIKSKL